MLTACFSGIDRLNILVNIPLHHVHLDDDMLTQFSDIHTEDFKTKCSTYIVYFRFRSLVTKATLLHHNTVVHFIPLDAS